MYKRQLGDNKVSLGSDSGTTTAKMCIRDRSKTDTAQAIADAEHKFDGDTGTTSVRKHGEVLPLSLIHI